MDQETNNLSSGNQEKRPESNKEIMWSIRIFALIIIAVVVVSGLTKAWSSKTAQVVVMTMSLLILAWSFRPFLEKNKKFNRWLIIILTSLLILGAVIFLVK